MIHAVNDQTFAAEVLQAEVPVLVDFWAPWCGPCKMLSPLLDELAQVHEGKLKVVKINIDEDGEAAARLSVRSVPTLILFKNAEVAGKAVGLQSMAKLEELIRG